MKRPHNLCHVAMSAKWSTRSGARIIRLEQSLWPASSLVRIMALLCHRCRNTHPLCVREEHTVARPSPTSRLDVLTTCGAFCCGVMTVVFIDVVMVLLFQYNRCAVDNFGMTRITVDGGLFLCVAKLVQSRQVWFK